MVTETATMGDSTAWSFVVENVYESAGWEGEAVNRRSDLLLNPDLLQNWTMGDYEADYCGLDLLG